jgi:hypothetical protein
MRSVKISVTTTGSAGSASGDGYSAKPVCGEVYAIRVDWHASAPGTSDITITFEGDDNNPVVTQYAKTDAVTDLWVYPVVQSTDTAGAAVSGIYQHPVGSGRIKASIAQSDALTNAAVVYVFLKE